VPVGDYHDDNWLTAKIQVCAGAFRGTVDAAIVTNELANFLAQLRALYENLRGTAEFTTLEEQLHLVLSSDRSGHVELAGDVVDQPGSGNRLNFILHFDPSQLRQSIAELERVADAFPVRAV
jgi:hypothetical protein